ncbi:MAG: IS701 family transposase, partial [Opitutaceae bacterium]|nr:IS701 family transposase [Opitutaceae bacterium]
NRAVKGINLLNALYVSHDVSIPVAFDIIKKEEVYYDEKEGQLKRGSEVSKNEHLRAMFETCIRNQLEFRYVLFDSWFCASMQ